MDLKDPVLASKTNIHDDTFHDPYWCDGLQNGNFSSDWYFGDPSPFNFGKSTYCDLTIQDCGCDSTRLDKSLYFDWGNLSPLPYDEPFSGRYPNDFFSAKWTGYIASPGTGDYEFVLSADYGAKLSIGGKEYISATPLPKSKMTFTVSMIAGERLPIEIEYYHYQSTAYFSLSWFGPGLSELTALSKDYLYYGREIMNSPVTVEIYPGVWDETTSSATGAGLTDCVSMSTCEFTIHARDTFGNRIFNWGEDDFNVTIRGIADWAGYDREKSRRNDINITSVAHVAPTVKALGWTYIGKGSISFGDSYLNTSSDFTGLIERGETLRVVTETMMVDLDEDKVITSTSVPLSRPFLGDSTMMFDVYKIENCTAGTYKVTYWPEIRGMYDLSIELPSVAEIQYVEFYAEGGLAGNFTVGLSAYVDKDLIQNTTFAIDIQSATEASIQSVLEQLNIVTSGVGVSIETQTEFNFQFKVTFTGMNADLPLLTLDTTNTIGNNFGTKVSQIQAGAPSRGIIDSPFKLTVAPNNTDAGFTTAYGQGLFYGVTGVTSKFTIQSKDRWGNNRLHNQTQDIYKVHAFIANRDYDDVSTAVEGTIVMMNLVLVVHIMLNLLLSFKVIM